MGGVGGSAGEPAFSPDLSAGAPHASNDTCCTGEDGYQGERQRQGRRQGRGEGQVDATPRQVDATPRGTAGTGGQAENQGRGASQSRSPRRYEAPGRTTVQYPTKVNAAFGDQPPLSMPPGPSGLVVDGAA